MSGRVCTYVRHVMSMALEGDYDFLDGAVCLNTCDHVRRAADLFVKKTGMRFNGFISVPRQPRESLFGYYLSELNKLKAGLENHFGIIISKNNLRAAIWTTNQIRARLQTINGFRRHDFPKISGADALTAHIAAQVLPPDIFIELADRPIEEVVREPGLESPAGRLFLIGAELDEPEYVAAIESQGALVVGDLLCFGSRAYCDFIDADAPDPLEAIARANFFRPSCARMIGDFPARWERLKSRVSESRAHGVIFERLVFCDPWGAEIHNILHRAEKEQAFPVLSLTREYGITPTGQLKTRVQAFLEKIEIARARTEI
jgi:benzoyl-CoA reductase/2-hydroxyglutaryl-CoA dehydratase subunit BcrC/BadD/HgdB